MGKIYTGQGAMSEKKLTEPGAVATALHFASRKALGLSAVATAPGSVTRRSVDMN